MRNLIKKVSEIYDLIAEQQKADPQSTGDCNACSKCCNFTEYDHRLYVTPPEIRYFKFHIGEENLKPMRNGVCPYKVNGKCAVYEWRFAGCRIFNCKGDNDFQNRLTETVLKELKYLCIQFSIPYHYSELSVTLKG